MVLKFQVILLVWGICPLIVTKSNVIVDLVCVPLSSNILFPIRLEAVKVLRWRPHWFDSKIQLRMIILSPQHIILFVILPSVIMSIKDFLLICKLDSFRHLLTLFLSKSILINYLITHRQIFIYKLVSVAILVTLRLILNIYFTAVHHILLVTLFFELIWLTLWIIWGISSKPLSVHAMKTCLTSVTII